MAEPATPERVEYVVVQLDADEGEIDTPSGPIPVKVMDLCDEVTVIGVPEELPLERGNEILKAIEAKAISTPARRFMVVHGLNERVRIVRFVRRDLWDEDLRERKLTPGPRPK